MILPYPRYISSKTIGQALDLRCWPQDMVAQMMEKGKVLMRVDGPYGRPYGPGWHKYDALVVIAGGIGGFQLSLRLQMQKKCGLRRRNEGLHGLILWKFLTDIPPLY